MEVSAVVNRACGNLRATFWQPTVRAKHANACFWGLACSDSMGENRGPDFAAQKSTSICSSHRDGQVKLLSGGHRRDGLSHVRAKAAGHDFYDR